MRRMVSGGGEQQQKHPPVSRHHSAAALAARSSGSLGRMTAYNVQPPPPITSHLPLHRVVSYAVAVRPVVAFDRNGRPIVYEPYITFNQHYHGQNKVKPPPSTNHHHRHPTVQRRCPAVIVSPNQLTPSRSLDSIHHPQRRIIVPPPPVPPPPPTSSNKVKDFFQRLTRSTSSSSSSSARQSSADWLLQRPSVHQQQVNQQNNRPSTPGLNAFRRLFTTTNNNQPVARGDPDGATLPSQVVEEQPKVVPVVPVVQHQSLRRVRRRQSTSKRHRRSVHKKKKKVKPQVLVNKTKKSDQLVSDWTYLPLPSQSMAQEKKETTAAAAAANWETDLYAALILDQEPSRRSGGLSQLNLPTDWDLAPVQPDFRRLRRRRKQQQQKEEEDDVDGMK